MTPIKDQLEHHINQWAALGGPAIMERFVLRNGKLYQPVEFAGKLMKRQQCFLNSSITADRGVGIYVEGFAIRDGLPLLVHHAWVGIGDTAADPTWPGATNCQYYGVEFDELAKASAQLECGYYGLLENPGTLINTPLMFRLDPELKGIVEEIVGHKLTKGELA